ncbi:MAG TPA: CDGSH iron-sulfur domain-containing protein [Burkholderiales bacterium]|nr:CDGSH iron-sulfur domain-containing protein [Burkholderiales bacterium]
MAKPKIACAPHGPYLLEDVPGLPRGAALCRCGGSKKKPFCDGTHRVNGFRDDNTADPVKNKRNAYAGKRITILDNRAICAHAGFCTDELKSVFRQHDEPWIEPDAAQADQIIGTIRKCPSGALSYAIDGVEAQPPQRPPMVTVTDNGPYAVTGSIELMGVKFGDGASAEHYTLCRCGASKNKPFCDGSHWEVGFKDPT